MKPREESEGERSSHDSCARFEEDEPTEPSSFSSFETRLWLVQRDTVHDIPDESSERRSFKTQTGEKETRSTPFQNLTLRGSHQEHSLSKEIDLAIQS